MNQMSVPNCTLRHDGRGKSMQIPFPRVSAQVVEVVYVCKLHPRVYKACPKKNILQNSMFYLMLPLKINRTGAFPIIRQNRQA